MARERQRSDAAGLPETAQAFIRRVIRRMRYRKKVRADVQAELIAHFEDELKDCRGGEEREQKVWKLVEEFGDARLLATLCRRAKKRCRPLWRKVAVRSFQAAALVIVYIVLCSARLFVGAPVLKINYLSWLTERTQAGRDDSQNAKPFIDEAIAALDYDESLKDVLSSPVRWPGDMNEPQQQRVAELIGSRSQACAKLREAVEKPYYWVRYEEAFQQSLANDPDIPKDRQWTGKDIDTAWALNYAVLPFLGDYRRLVRAFGCSIVWKAYEGDSAGALDDATVLIEFCTRLQGRGMVTEQLAGVAFEALANRLAFEIVARCDVEAVDLADCQKKLEDLYGRHKCVIDVAADKAVFYALVQRGFTDDGHGNGRVLREGVPLVVGDWKDAVTQLLLFGYPDRREITRRIDAFYGEAQLQLERTPYQAGNEDLEGRLTAIADGSILLQKLAGSRVKIGYLVWNLWTGRSALVATLALMRYEKDKGVYPENLEQLLSAGYVTEIPLDPYGDGAMTYRKTPDGFTLYSWGRNLRDDGGHQGTGRDGRPRMFADNGDWVFWPVEDGSE